MSIRRKVVQRVVKAVNNNPVTFGSGLSSIVDDFENGIHLDFVRNYFYTKVPGQEANVALFTSLFTFTGDNKSMYRGSNGLLKQSATNVPRIEYDASGNLLGLLVEGTRTNLALWSSDGTNVAWVKSNMTNAQTSVGPDGVTNSATRLTASAGNATILQTVTSASATRAYSVWLKRVTGTGNIDLTVDNGTTWTTKTITTSWVRYDISQAAVTNPVFGIRIVTSGDAVDFAANNLESASFSSSYIPTTTASVTRAADSAIRTLGTEYNQNAGSSLVMFRTEATTDLMSLAAFDDGTDNTQISHTISAAGGAFALSIRIGAVQQANTGFSPGVYLGLTKRVAGAYQTNDFNSSFEGVLATPDVAGSMPTVDRLRLNHATGFWNPFFGHIRRLDYWPERKSNARLMELTS